MSDPNDVMMQEFDLEVCLDSYSVFNSHEEELNAIELAVDQQHPIYNPEKNKVKRWRHLFYSLSEGLDYYRVTYIQKPVVIETHPVQKLSPGDRVEPPARPKFLELNAGADFIRISAITGVTRHIGEIGDNLSPSWVNVYAGDRHYRVEFELPREAVAEFKRIKAILEVS